MKLFLIVIQMHFLTLCYAGNHVYTVFSDDNNTPVNMIYDIDKELFILGDVINNTVFEECSSEKFYCLKTKSERFFVPQSIEIGEYDSVNGKLKVLEKITSNLPLNSTESYYLIEFYKNDEPDYRIYYNDKRGIIAFLYKINRNSKEFKQIAWLTSKLGLLSKHKD